MKAEQDPREVIEGLVINGASPHISNGCGILTNVLVDGKRQASRGLWEITRLRLIVNGLSDLGPDGMLGVFTLSNFLSLCPEKSGMKNLEVFLREKVGNIVFSLLLLVKERYKVILETRRKRCHGKIGAAERFS